MDLLKNPRSISFNSGSLSLVSILSKPCWLTILFVVIVIVVVRGRCMLVDQRTTLWSPFSLTFM